ncbi:PH domain-containing protein [Kaistella palustris]|uniref:PH domain-containing protein n=1 Tax=Kaistella palustris TaxID=493376 RepID=UPI000415B68E|nr:PH domain-containing protein [Kaistella palustris]
MADAIFRSKPPDKTFLLLYAGVVVFLWSIAFYTYLQKNDPLVFLPVGIICTLILFLTLASHLWLKIIIRDHFLTVHLIFEVSRKDIRHITKIRKGETMWSGFEKFGTVTKGLIIFTKYKNDLYISPENEELFFRKILEVNPEIVIERV